MATKVIESEYEDVCAVCLRVIAVGDRIAREPGAPVRHADCPPTKGGLFAYSFTAAGRHYHASAAERSALLTEARAAQEAAAGGGLGPVTIAGRVAAIDACYTFADANVARAQLARACERRAFDAVRERILASVR